MLYHDLHKNQNEDTATIDLHKEMDIKQRHNHFLRKLIDGYKKSNRRNFSEFREKQEKPVAPSFLKEFLDKKTNFDNLSQKLMNLLKEKACKERLSNGGKVVFVNYDEIEEEKKQECFLIAILSEQASFLAQDGDIDEKQTLDLRHLKFAGRINLSMWEQEQERYISFIKGNGDIAHYFQKFLHCKDVIDFKKETARLLKIAENFANNFYQDIDKKINFLSKTHSYLHNLATQESSFEVKTYIEFINQDQDIQMTDDLIMELENTLSDLDNGVSDGFIPNKDKLNSLTIFKASVDSLKISFGYDAIKKGYLIKDRSDIIIKNAPKELLKAWDNNDNN
ncbi:nucleoid-associated protein [Helicobacter cetorum]|uniref:nucleoid-associated protein n=1 Tax=Helicobacter cetorum TaxID=138563 RepID=UPI002277BB4E|nr:nucleoid-associated protein [Helicobacter cetorum]